MWVVPTVAVDNNCRCQVDVAEGPVEIMCGDRRLPCFRLLAGSPFDHICAVYVHTVYTAHTHSASVMRVNDATLPVALVNRMHLGSELS